VKDYIVEVVFATREPELRGMKDLSSLIEYGASPRASIALALAAHHNPRVARVVAINPYDYGRWGGIRRSSSLAKVLFTAMLWP